MKKDKVLTTRTYNNLFQRIAEILNQARTTVVREINRAQVLAYWEIGREIVEFEQKGKLRAEYGEEQLKRLSADMIFLAPIFRICGSFTLPIQNARHCLANL